MLMASHGHQGFDGRHRGPYWDSLFSVGLNILSYLVAYSLLMKYIWYIYIYILYPYYIIFSTYIHTYIYIDPSAEVFLKGNFYGTRLVIISPRAGRSGFSQACKVCSISLRRRPWRAVPVRLGRLVLQEFVVWRYDKIAGKIQEEKNMIVNGHGISGKVRCKWT